MFSFNDNRKTIKELYSMFESGSLIVDNSYQRRSVWNEKDKARLIETILLNLIIPELFFWKAETDPESGDSLTHIVDGQQRIKAICSFVNNEFKLKPQYLLDEEIKEKFADMFFKDFEAEDKKAFWNYSLMIIEIDQNATKTDIITMFNRLNLTDYSLNDQEKRNSMSGDFAVLARELSENPFWDEYHLFSSSDVKRMKDVEFCASLIVLLRRGIVDQTNQVILNQIYEELQTDYCDAEEDKNAILFAIESAKEFFVSNEANTFLKKKTQLYSLFSVLFYMQREKIQVTKGLLKHFDGFVRLYSVFKANMELDTITDSVERQIVDLLKKYKLASSEGLNKHTNRMVRYNVMRSFLFEMDGFDKEIDNLYLHLSVGDIIIQDDPDMY